MFPLQVRQTGYTRSHIANRARRVIFTLCSGLVRPHQDLCPVLGPPVQEGCGKTGEGPTEAAKMVRGLEHSTCEGRELALSSLLKRRQRGHLPGACDCLKGSYRHETAKLLQRQTMQ